jgi:hypothetical protein
VNGINDDNRWIDILQVFFQHLIFFLVKIKNCKNIYIIVFIIF